MSEKDITNLEGLFREDTAFRESVLKLLERIAVSLEVQSGLMNRGTAREILEVLRE